MASPSVRRATYRLVMDFTHLCLKSSMYMQQLGTSAKNGGRPTSCQLYHCPSNSLGSSDVITYINTIILIDL